MDFSHNRPWIRRPFSPFLKVKADQGRLGGLFKLWLSGQGAPSAETPEIQKLLSAIEEGQRKLKAVIGSLRG